MALPETMRNPPPVSCSCEGDPSLCVVHGDDAPKPGEVWTHLRTGGRYIIEAIHPMKSGPFSWAIVYQREDDLHSYVRILDDWYFRSYGTTAEETVRRFVRALPGDASD